MTKKSKLIKLLKKPDGTTLTAISKSLSWQPHTVRAAISRLKKDGLTIERVAGPGKGYRYRIISEDTSCGS